MAAKGTKAGEFTLVIPIDASGIDDRDEPPDFKVVVIDREGELHSEPVRLNKAGRGEVKFAFNEPSGLRVLLGPADASDKEMEGLQTLAIDVSGRSWATDTTLQLEPVLVPPFYWNWWRHWCRTYTIHGKVVCADGSPVPGAVVCAKDVDVFWWWCSEQQVGCATTDANGAFSMKFRWCCGWWPWWWWAQRVWRVEPFFAEPILDALRTMNPNRAVKAPDPVPDFAIFDELLAPDGVSKRKSGPIIDPERLDELRPQLLERLPVRISPKLAAYPLWPWQRWHPWSDCNPDINFTVTQDWGEGEVVILDEDSGDTRWNIPTTLDTTLVVSDDACCVPVRPPPCPEGNCLVLSHICDDLVATVGGNTGAPASPAGYRDPGVAAIHGDRPYAGVVPISGVCGDWIDYYEFEMSTDGVSWSSLPPTTTGGHSLIYFDPVTVSFVPVSFVFATVDGRWVIESLAHWESVNGPKIWVGNITTLMRWRTAPIIADDSYNLRLKAYTELGGTLTDQGNPPLCGSNVENRAVVTVDNRLTGPAAGHPTTPDHSCGINTVHTCTTEPDTDFIAIRINGNPVGPCAIVDAGAKALLEIDFLAHDPDQHLAYYTLRAMWGENNSRNLLDPAVVPSATLTRLSAAQVGPTYGDARLGGSSENAPAAVAPAWAGGTMRLTITNLVEAFPEPCCYLLDLRAYKRTIDSCNDDYTHRNHSTYTFTVT